MFDVLLQLIGTILVWSLLAIGGALMLAAYFLPTIIVLLRRAHSMYAVVIVVNALLGWTFIGWFVSLVLSLVAFSSSHQHHYYAYPQAPYQPAPATNGYLPDYASVNGSSPDAAAVAAPPSEDA